MPVAGSWRGTSNSPAAGGVSRRGAGLPWTAPCALGATKTRTHHNWDAQNGAALPEADRCVACTLRLRGAPRQHCHGAAWRQLQVRRASNVAAQHLAAGRVIQTPQMRRVRSCVKGGARGERRRRWREREAAAAGTRGGAYQSDRNRREEQVMLHEALR